MKMARRLLNCAVRAIAFNAILVIAVSAQAHNAQRNVQLVEFGAAEQPAPGRTNSVFPSLMGAMHSGFGALIDSQTAKPLASEYSGQTIRSEPRPFVLVPRWMRKNANIGAIFTPQPAQLPTGECILRAYSRSYLLGDAAEKRRRLLYMLVQQAACNAGLPVNLIDALLIQESRYDPFALSPKGAFGLGQLMPDTAHALGVDRYDLRGNLSGAARYLRMHLDSFGQVDLALAAYNAGPGRVRGAGGVPHINETRFYVRQILSNWLQLDNQETQSHQSPETSDKTTIGSAMAIPINRLSESVASN
jgi:soluble lytic murein transglycosylase-like protein